MQTDNLNSTSHGTPQRDSLLEKMSEFWKLNTGNDHKLTKVCPMNQRFAKPTQCSTKLGSSESKRKCRIHMKMGYTPKFNLDDKKGKFSMLPRSDKWIKWNITMGTGDPKLHEKYYNINIGKVGPWFDKLEKRDYILYNTDLSWNAGYIDLDNYDKSYKYLGHVEKPSGINMQKMLYRKQFVDTSYSRPATTKISNGLHINQISSKRGSKNLSMVEAGNISSYLKAGSSKVRKNFSNLLMDNGYIRRPSDVEFGALNSKSRRREKNWNRQVINRKALD